MCEFIIIMQIYWWNFKIKLNYNIYMYMYNEYYM